MTVSLKLKALAIIALRRGKSPRDAMDSVQKATRRDVPRDELARAVEAAQQADLAKPLK